ncbi:hypothetical protein [Actinomadura sp. WMMA1423]|uniref:hypothetical protein n=1 Tax=Actinomadura sp. WMMA1423 TaxID=2591108 RepID=UPI001146F715|nr:hypothetical protein [Actinomadura sp. WMMA1423]
MSDVPVSIAAALVGGLADALGPAAGVLARAMPFGTIAVAAFVPLAAGLYLLTSGAWTAAERAVLHRRAAAAI